MSVATTQALVDLLGRSRLLTVPQQTELVQQLQRRFPEPRALTAHLVGCGWLTSFQANQLFLGKGAGLVLGPYVLLERLGEGGAGQVFKARHAASGRLVALKTIRAELLADVETVQRFSREVQLISRLNHPHIVRASDGAAEGLRGVLVMEYIEGIDLHHLVERRGPLPAVQACDYIRQSALALQHIHEQGLVHRDIKPPNLFVTQLADRPPWGVVKLLDLGLARLTQRTDSKTLATVTQTGMVLGTLDYLAPEQALDFREVDIRADIYALGCTLFFLLTGRPPFPEGTAAQKLLLHQLREPPAVESLRPDLPPHLPALVRKMLAKQPADRFQTPGEVALYLANPQLAPGVERPPEARAADGERTVRVVPAPTAPANLPRWRNRALVGLAGVALLAVLLVVLVVAGSGKSPTTLAAGPFAGQTTASSGSAGSAKRPTETVYLADLPEREVATAPVMQLRKGPFYWFGTLRPLAINGKVAAKGLMVHPPGSGVGQVKYQLDQPFAFFRTGVGLIDSVTGSPTPLKFRIIGDGRVLWESRPVQKPGDLQETNVSVAGVKLLELAIDCPGPDHGGANNTAHALWFDPQLLR